MADIRTVGCLGLLTIDVNQRVRRFPQPNEKVAATETFLDFGGPAANAAATAAGLGSASWLATYAGTMPESSFVRMMMDETGVQLVPLVASSESTLPVSTVVVSEENGDRTVISSHALVPTALEIGGPLPNADILLVDGHYMDAAIEATAKARREGTPVLFDGGSYKEGLSGLLPNVDVAVVSNDFHLPGMSWERLIEFGPKIIARSNGPQPIEVISASQRATVDVPEVPVVDTNGAGDALHGALAHYLAQTDDLSFSSVVCAIRDAAKLASLSCGFNGARGWITQTRG